MDPIKVELRHHIGTSPSGVLTDHQQYIVMADGTHIGYLPKRPGSWVACIVAMDDDVKEKIQEEINKMLDMPIGGVVMPPEPVEEEEDDDE